MAKSIVFCFGRFSPPTIGHAMLINKVLSLAASKGADNLIFTSSSFDNDRNPLTFKDKVSFLQQLFPKASVSTNKTLTSIHQIAKYITSKGYDDVTFVVGSDRVEEFNRALGKYVVPKTDPKFDKSKHYPWDKFEIVSAGERDPDAEGIAGASGTKMRGYVRDGDFKSFMQNIPNSGSNVILARRIFNAVKSNLSNNIKEEFITEGVNDKAIFKAVFLSGGPGSGKDFILKNVLKGHGLVEINSDTAFEFLMKREVLDMKMPDSETQQRDILRGCAKNITKEKERLALIGRLGVIINSTAADVGKITYMKHKLELMGYECKLLVVKTSDDISRARNIMRGEHGGRTVPEPIRAGKWLESNGAIGPLKSLFGDSNHYEIDNNIDIRIAPPEIKEKQEATMMRIFKSIKKWVDRKASNTIANGWMEQENKKKINEDFESYFSGF